MKVYKVADTTCIEENNAAPQVIVDYDFGELGLTSEVYSLSALMKQAIDWTTGLTGCGANQVRIN